MTFLSKQSNNNNGYFYIVWRVKAYTFHSWQAEGDKTLATINKFSFLNDVHPFIYLLNEQWRPRTTLSDEAAFKVAPRHLANLSETIIPSPALVN